MKKQMLLAVVAAAANVYADVSAIVDPDGVRFPVPQDMWGIFFEDIDLSLDGGIYAELVRNGGFEDGENKYRKQRSIGWWKTLGRATVETGSERPVSAKNPHYMKIEALPGGGAANEGFFGIGVEKGAKYRFSAAMRGSAAGGVEVSLESPGRVLAKGRVDGVGPEWKTFSLELSAEATDPDANLVLRLPSGGSLRLDCVSLMPAATYGKSGLFRKDLMERLAALKPSFVRFPGGCWVEGDTMKEAYRWKTTLGDRWERRTQWNLWGYWSSNAVGFHEYLLLCEELGAKALFCINCGMSHKENVPLDRMGEYVQDALDAIEYANGPADSKWGAVRAAAGHPEPFRLEYLEIGNENGGKAYHERYALIHDAVTNRYPDVKIVSDLWRGHVEGRPQHIRDEHFYHSPDWFMAAAKMYDSRPRGEYEVFVGEYAVTRGTGRWGSLRAAIGEAAFMCGLERNADLVKMAAYAPLFANAKHTAWTPNLIYPTTDGNFVSPSWHVQRLFSAFRGKDVLAVETVCGKFMNGEKEPKECDEVVCSAVRDGDGSVILKIVNCTDRPQPAKISFKGEGRKIATAAKIWFSGPGADASNSPLDREALGEKFAAPPVADGAVQDVLPPLSLGVYKLGVAR